MLNKVILHGRLTADPELRQTQSGISSCSFTVAVERSYKGANGEKQTDFIKCQAWRQTAEFVSRYFSKGSLIIVDGSLQNNNYTDKSGVNHYTFVVNADSVSFGGSKTDNTVQSQQSAPDSAEASQPPDEPVEIGDLGDFEEILSDGDVPY
ncbi:MAG: single-stranded DNA-binding protein [Porcipelethomonas sp.]